MKPLLLLLTSLLASAAGCRNEPAQEEKCILLDDQVSLIHIKGRFYKDKYGHLYLKTRRQKGSLPDGEPLFEVFFTGEIPQEIDLNSFEEIEPNGFKDKYHSYHIYPMSCGEHIRCVE